MGCGRDGVCSGGHGLTGLVRGRIDWVGGSLNGLQTGRCMLGRTWIDRIGAGED